MAQQTKSTSKSNGATSRKASGSRSGSRTRSSSKSGGSKATSSKRSTAKRNGGRPKRARTASGRPGSAVAKAASSVKTPLVAGGTALIGVAAGAVLKDRLVNRKPKNPLRRLPEIDIDTVKKAAERVSAYGQQASDIAAAVEKTRKKHK